MAAAAFALLACALLAMRLRRVRADQRRVLGDEEHDLVAHAAGLARQVDDLRRVLADGVNRLEARLDDAELRLDGAISKSSVLRYDAFNETSGRQSSTVALLDDGDNGVVVSAILQRDQARVYAKPVVGGSSPLKLSPEELEAMEQARRGPASAGGAQ